MKDIIKKNNNYRAIENIEELENVRYVRVRPLKINFSTSEYNEIVLERKSDGIEGYPVHVLSSNGEVIGQFVNLKEAKKYIIEDMDQDLNSMGQIDVNDVFKKINRVKVLYASIKIAALLAVLGILSWYLITMMK